MFKNIESKSDIIKNFTPSWFAAVMGTGILAILTHIYSAYLPILEQISLGLYFFNIGLFCILLIPWVMRWIYFPEEAKSDLHHPITTNFYPTIGVGILVIAADTIIIVNNLKAAMVIWLIGVIITIYFSVLVPYIIMTSSDIKKEHINPAWFIPPVGLIVVPIPGALLVSQYTGLTREIIIIVNVVCWGAGFFLYLGLLSITMYRFFTHSPLPNTLYPTIWINLGPIGAGTTSLVNIISNCTLITQKEPIFLMAFLFWGFGLWWITMAFVLMFHYIRKVKIPYAMSWWAFTFPLGAYVSATHSISVLFNLNTIDYLGFALYWLLVLFWSTTLVFTAINSFNGKNFVTKR